LSVRDVRACQPVACNGEHLGADIDADRALQVGRKQFEHPAGPGSGIEQEVHRRRCDVTHDRGFDVFLRRMQRTDALPLRRVGLEVDRKSTRLNSSHGYISYAVFCLKKKNKASTSLFYNILQKL